ncbi:MAG: hypothetical protein NVSMB20_07310 [Bradyrhizobium sp.]
MCRALDTVRASRWSRAPPGVNSNKAFLTGFRRIPTQFFANIRGKARPSITGVDMSHPTAKFASALFASVLAGACLGTVSPGVARAAEECLAAPKGASPEGSHWFYRIDHATKRHCWYLGQRDKHAQTAARSTRSEKPTAAKKIESSTSRSIANARAELPASTSNGQQDQNDDTSALAAPAQPVTVAENTRTAAPGSETQGSVVASRWPEFPPASVPSSPPPAMARLAANLASDAAAASAPAVAAVPPATADTPREGGSVVMLLAVITGALALAGIIASVVFKFGGVRRLVEQGGRPQRGSIWDRTDDDSVRPFNVLSFAHAEEDAASTDFGHGFEPRDHRRERVAEFFTQLSQRAPT